MYFIVFQYSFANSNFKFMGGQCLSVAMQHTTEQLSTVKYNTTASNAKQSNGMQGNTTLLNTLPVFYFQRLKTNDIEYSYMFQLVYFTG